MSQFASILPSPFGRRQLLELMEEGKGKWRSLFGFSPPVLSQPTNQGNENRRTEINKSLLFFFQNPQICVT